MKRGLSAVVAFVLLLSPLAFAQEPQSSAAAAATGAEIADILARAEVLDPLKAVVVARNGETLAERGYRGNSTSVPTNIKSASKAIISALVGIAIDQGTLEGVDQKIAPLLTDPRMGEITIGHLLSMQAGLGRTSGRCSTSCRRWRSQWL